MHNPIINLTNRKGIALIASYMLLVVLLILVTAFLNRSIFQNRAIILFEKRVQAFNLAESGLDRAINWFRAQPSPPTCSTPPCNISWTLGVQSLGASGTTNTPVIGTYNLAITDLGEPTGSPGTRRYQVVSTGTVGSITWSLRNYIQTDNYARYIWFTDNETYSGSNVWFVTDDFLDGPTHTNSHFHIYGTPVFAGTVPVQSSDDYIDFYHRSNDQNFPGETSYSPDIPDFRAGYIFGADQTNMPTQALNLRTASTATGGLRLQGDTTVVLNSNGTMNVTNSNMGWTTPHNMTLPANGALFVACGGSRCSQGGSLTISGTLSGRLTVGAERNVYIPTNVTYSNDPRTNPASTDTLGVISEQNVVIDDHAPNNLEIDGSIMALNTSFMMENYDDTHFLKDILTVYGGIIQDQRGPVGTFSGFDGNKLSGYTKNYSWDSRLLDNPPPFFPTTGDYITLSWED